MKSLGNSIKPTHIPQKKFNIITGGVMDKDTLSRCETMVELVHYNIPPLDIPSFVLKNINGSAFEANGNYTWSTLEELQRDMCIGYLKSMPLWKRLLCAARLK